MTEPQPVPADEPAQDDDRAEQFVWRPGDIEPDPEPEPEEPTP